MPQLAENVREEQRLIDPLFRIVKQAVHLGHVGRNVGLHPPRTLDAAPVLLRVLHFRFAALQSWPCNNVAIEECLQ